MKVFLELDDVQAEFVIKDYAQQLGIKVDFLRKLRKEVEDSLATPYGSGLQQMENQYAFITQGSKVIDINALAQGSLSEYDLTDFGNANKHLVTGEGKQLTDQWLRSRNTTRLRSLVFAPDRRSELTISKGSYNLLNTYIHPQWHHDGEIPVATLEHIKFLLPDEDERTYFLNWLSYLVQNPGARLPMVLMVSTCFGVGRGTLNTVLRRMFGSYARETSFKSLCGNSPYNDWMSKTVLVTVGETKEANSKSSEAVSRIEAYEHIKSIIDTAPLRDVVINPK